MIHAARQVIVDLVGDVSLNFAGAFFIPVPTLEKPAETHRLPSWAKRRRYSLVLLWEELFLARGYAAYSERRRLQDT